MSFNSLLNRLDKAITTGKATILHVFDIRPGQGNVTLIGIRQKEDNHWILDKMFISASKLNSIMKKLKESFAQGRLLKIEILQLQGGRITVVNKMEPSEISIEKLIKMVDEEAINGNKQIKILHTEGRFVEVQGIRTILQYNGVPIQLRTYKSSLWISLMLDAFKDGESDGWEMIMVITISPQSIVQHGIYEISDDKLIEYGPTGAFTLYAALPIKPVSESEETKSISEQVETPMVKEEKTEEASEEGKIAQILGESAKQIVKMAIGEEK